MYLDFFNLKEFPFSLASDLRFFFSSGVHAEALANMLYAVQQRKGMVLITGEVGTGKTFVSNVLAARLGLSAVVSVLRHPPGSARQLIRSVAAGLGASVPPKADRLAGVEHLARRLGQLYARDRLAVAILDELQDFSDDALEEVRLMWNCEQDGQRLLQIVLVGQPEVRRRLAEARWASLRQRIVLAYHLGRLDPADTPRYVRHRLSVAAKDDCGLEFSPEALEKIHAASQGVPRLINVLCDGALLAAYARGTHRITPEIIETVVRDMTGPSLHPEGEEESQPAAPPVPAPAAGPPAPAGLPASSPDARILEAALQGRPAVEVARETYRVAEHGSDAHHLAIRVIMQELIATLRTRRPPHGRADAQNGNPSGGGGDPPAGRGNGQGGLGRGRGPAGPPAAG